MAACFYCSASNYIFCLWTRIASPEILSIRFLLSLFPLRCADWAVKRWKRRIRKKTTEEGKKKEGAEMKETGKG